MSEVKLKLVDAIDDCKGCKFNSDLYCSAEGEHRKQCGVHSVINQYPPQKIEKIWVVDDKSDSEPQTQWVEIEDAELVDGEWYWVMFDNTSKLQWISMYSVKDNGFLVGTIFYPEYSATHVIHLPKPQPPKL